MPFPSRPPGGAPGNAARKSQAHTRVATQVDLIFEIFKTFGLPSSDGLLVQLPNYPAQPPKLVVGKGDWRRKFPLEEPQLEEEFLAMLSGFFELEPGARATPTQAMSGGCFSYLTPDLRCRALVCEAPAGRGPVSLVQGAVGRRTLSWLQSDPYWAELPQKVGAPKTHKVCHAACENDLKHEEGGYTRTQAPSTKLCSRIDCSAPCPAVRVRAFAKALVACNHGWLVQLTQEVRSKLRKFPPTFLKENGERFMTSCFSDTIFAYAILQVMKPGERHDLEHHDEGASLLHAGLTIFGRRGLEMQTAAVADSAAPAVPSAAVAGSAAPAVKSDASTGSEAQSKGEEWQRTLWQAPGDFYVGNLCAVWHRVRHQDAAKSEPLFWVAGSAADGPLGVHITVMMRSDVFSRSRARGLSLPSPTDVFHVANAIVARRLAREPLVLPTLEECQRHC